MIGTRLVWEGEERGQTYAIQTTQKVTEGDTVASLHVELKWKSWNRKRFDKDNWQVMDQHFPNKIVTNLFLSYVKIGLLEPNSIYIWSRTSVNYDMLFCLWFLFGKKKYISINVPFSWWQLHNLHNIQKKLTDVYYYTLTILNQTDDLANCKKRDQCRKFIDNATLF